MTARTSNQTLYFFGGANVPLDDRDRLSLKIQSFRNLKNGWRFGEGRSATEMATQTAMDALNCFFCAGAQSIEVFPEVDGGILVSGYYGHDTLDVICHYDGLMGLVHEVADQEVADIPKISMNDFADYLGRLEWATTSLSELFTHESLVKKRESSRVLLSRLLKTVAFHSLMWSVPETLVGRNANIFSNFIQGGEEKNQFYGESLSLLSLREAPLSLSHQAPEILVIET